MSSLSISKSVWAPPKEVWSLTERAWGQKDGMLYEGLQEIVFTVSVISEFVISFIF